MNRSFYSGRRNSHLFQSNLTWLARELSKDPTKTILITSKEEDTYGQRIVNVLRENFNIDTQIIRATKKIPAFPYERTYDEFGECTGMRTIPQVEIFAGWKLSIVKTNEANEKNT